MTDFQPRYVAYARSHGREPEAQSVADRQRWPLAPNIPFTEWLSARWREFEALTGRTGCSPEDHPVFDAWPSLHATGQEDRAARAGRQRGRPVTYPESGDGRPCPGRRARDRAGPPHRTLSGRALGVPGRPRRRTQPVPLWKHEKAQRRTGRPTPRTHKTPTPQRWSAGAGVPTEESVMPTAPGEVRHGPVLTVEEATEMALPEGYDPDTGAGGGTWTWADPILAGASNSHDWESFPYWDPRHGHFDNRVSRNVIESLYRCGYALVKVLPEDGGS